VSVFLEWKTSRIEPISFPTYNKMDLLDELAETLHRGWMHYMRARGYTLGPHDEEKKTHPHLISWSEKEDKDKNQDRFQAAIILRAWYREDLKLEEIPKVIHESWRDWMKICGQGGVKPYDRPFEDIHSQDPMDHGVQAPLVYSFLQKLPPR
jgi:hypothetical protein